MHTEDYKYKTEPFVHQYNATKFAAVESPEFHALFMEQGTGKTKVTIDLACNWFNQGAIDCVLLIAPNGVHEQWYTDEVPKHYSAPISGFLWRSSQKNATKLKAWMNQKKGNRTTLKMVFVNVEAFSLPTYVPVFKELLKTFKTFVVVDEATCISNPTAKRTSNIVNGLSDCVYSGKRLIRRKPLSVKRSILTGTPEAKGPYKLWAMFDFLQENYFGLNYYAYKAHYGMEKQIFFPGMVRAVNKPLEPSDFKNIRKKYNEEGLSEESIAAITGIRLADVQYIINNPEVETPYKNLGELKAKVAKHAFIVRKEDCLDLPPKVYERIIVEMSPEQKAIYKSMVYNAVAFYQKHELTALNKASISIRLRQIAGGFFPANYEHIEDLGLPVKLEETITKPIGDPVKAKAIIRDLEEVTRFPVIIACAFKAEANYMHQACLEAGYKSVLITGDVAREERKQAMTDYKANEAEVLVATTGTIAKGYNLQNGSITYIYSDDWDTENRLQLEDRTHRNGQTADKVVYKDIMVKGSLDEAIHQHNKGNKAFQEYMRSSDVSDFFRLVNYTEEVKEIKEVL